MKIVIMIMVSLLIFASAKAVDSVPQAVITTGVSSSAEPLTNNLSVIDHNVGRVVFYTEIIGYRGQSVQHRWFYNGNEISTVTLNVASNRSLNWSQSSVSPGQLGKWEARVVDDRGNVLASRHFEVVESSHGVNAVVEQKRVDSCSVQLAELRKNMQENPTVDYYRFLYERQAERCP